VIISSSQHTPTPAEKIRAFQGHMLEMEPTIRHLAELLPEQRGLLERVS
jgi:hypothetical protein